MAKRGIVWTVIAVLLLASAMLAGQQVRFDDFNVNRVERVQPGTLVSLTPPEAKYAVIIERIERPIEKSRSLKERFGDKERLGEFITRRPKLSLLIGAGIAAATFAIAAKHSTPSSAPLGEVRRGVCTDPNPRVCGVPLPGVGRGR